MFNINGGEFIIILVVALLVIGPQRLPEYTEKLRDLIRSLRRRAESAKTQVKDEFGDDLQGIEWRKLDPRQYDPRRIVRETLAEEIDDFKQALTLDEGEPAAPEPESSFTASSVEREDRLRNGRTAPFDSEAT